MGEGSTLWTRRLLKVEFSWTIFEQDFEVDAFALSKNVKLNLSFESNRKKEQWIWKRTVTKYLYFKFVFFKETKPSSSGHFHPFFWFVMTKETSERRHSSEKKMKDEEIEYNFYRFPFAINRMKKGYFFYIQVVMWNLPLQRIE